MFIDIDGASIYVKEAGSGKDHALLLHGVPDTAELWNQVIAGIKNNYRCFAPDMPGFSRSGIPRHFAFTFDHYAEFVDELIDAANINTPLNLIIHDWGGIHGMLWACKYPHKVKRIVGGSFPFSKHYKWHEWASIWRTPVLGELSMLLINWLIFHWEIKRGSKRLSREQIRAQYVGRASLPLTRKTVLKMYRSADPHLFDQFSTQLKTLIETTPIDLIWGQNDPYIPLDEARYINSRSIKVVPNCGHWVPEEAPEEYIDIILKDPGDNGR